MDILTCSLAPSTSARANSFMAEGPTGINIMVNHKMGSPASRSVCDTSAHTTLILILVLGEIQVSAEHQNLHEVLEDMLT